MHGTSVTNSTLLLTVVHSTDLEVRRKAIGIVLSLTSSRNVEDVVLFLKKQLQKTQEQDFEKVCIMRSCAVSLVLTVHRLRSTGSF